MAQPPRQFGPCCGGSASQSRTRQPGLIRARGRLRNAAAAWKSSSRRLMASGAPCQVGRGNIAGLSTPSISSAPRRRASRHASMSPSSGSACTRHRTTYGHALRMADRAAHDRAVRPDEAGDARRREGSFARSPSRLLERIEVLGLVVILDCPVGADSALPAGGCAPGSPVSESSSLAIVLPPSERRPATLPEPGMPPAPRRRFRPTPSRAARRDVVGGGTLPARTSRRNVR